MHTFHLLLIFAFFGALKCDHQTEEVHRSKESIQKTAQVDDVAMARFLTVDYAFETESVLHGNHETKPITSSTPLAGNLSFSSLHYDLHGGMLAKFSLTACRIGNCGDVPDVYVAFIQGGNNIQEVFYDPTMIGNGKPQWNIIYAIVNAIYTPAENGQGDEQTVNTVYGRCLTQFSRPENKRFRRRIFNCDVKGDSNYTRIGGIQQVMYDQDVSYIQNTKIDADIVLIDAVEVLTYRTPFDKTWGFMLESKLHVEITNRTMHYVQQYCNSEQSVSDCARKKFGAVSVGKKLYEEVQLSTKKPENRFAQLVSNYRSHLYEMGDTHTYDKHSLWFSQIVQESRLASRQDWYAVIMSPENDPILHILGNVLGALGSSLSLTVAREVLLVEAPDIIDDYLFGVAHSTSGDEQWQKKLMYWLADINNNDALYWKVANTIATVLKRRCDQTISKRKSCHMGKEKIVSKFINDISKCQTEQCSLKSLHVLRNIPISTSVEMARGYLCSTHSTSLQIAALQLIKAASSSLYDSKLSNVLIKLFRNVCPRPTTTVESQLAIDILVRCIPDQQHVGTMLFRTETLNPDNHEKWQYLYKAVKSTGQQDILKKEYWEKLRRFKIFRPNYAHRALMADSNRDWREIVEYGGYKLQSTGSMSFQSGVFKASEFNLIVKHTRKEENLFGFVMDVTGLDSLDFGQTMSANPQAEFRLSVLGHSLPPVTLFKNSAELMNIVWNSNGQTIKAFEGNVMLRDTSSTIPLLSGLTVQVNSTGALSLKLLTSALVSLWNQQSLGSMKANVSMSLQSSAFLLHHGEIIQKFTSDTAMVTTIGAEARVSFVNVPFDVCLTIQSGDVYISSVKTDETTKKPRTKKTLTRSRTHRGITFRLDEQMTKKCNLLRDLPPLN